MGTEKRERQKANRQLRLEQMAKDRRRTKAKTSGLRWALALAGALVLVFGIVWLAGDDEKPVTAPTTTGVAGAAPCPAADGSSERRTEFSAAPDLCIDPAKTYTATFDTSEGTWVAQLDTARTPLTTNNFVYLARYHFYDGTKIFRADSSIDIIQGGGESPSSDFGYTIPDEGGKFTYQAGDLVMARTGAPNSAGAQFFVAGGPKVSNLDGQGTYVTFGKVTSGLDVVTKLVGYADPNNSMGISKPVTVNKITITESAGAGSTPGSTPGSSAPSTAAPSTVAPSTVAAATTLPATSAPATTKA